MNNLNEYVQPVRRNTVFAGINEMEHGGMNQTVDYEQVDLEGLEFMRGVMPEEENMQDGMTNLTEVEPDYLPMVRENLVKEWVIEKYNMVNESDDSIQSKMDELMVEKTRVRKIARDYIHCFFVEGMKSQGIKNVRTMKDIKDY